MLSKEGHKLLYTYDAEKLWIEPWGANALRVRSTKTWHMHDENWALTMPIDSKAHNDTKIEISDHQAIITNGSINATVSKSGKIIVRNTTTNNIILEEYARNRDDLLDPKCSSLAIEAREFAPILGTDNYKLSMRFESQDPEERIFGGGQYQQPFMNLKGIDLELAHRNSQASVPFFVSSLGYGFLWNNPGIGRVTFGKHVHTFESYSTNVLDYWVVASPENKPSELMEAYASVTGTVPMMPEYGLGFWQCKLRYQTQEELLEVAREYRRRKLPIDVIVCDFFHWELQGEWDFDRTYWPDPDAMVKELHSLNIELMVSIWPTVDKRSSHYQDMLHKGHLIRTDRGIRTAMDIEGNTVHYDATNPTAREHLWSISKQNYHDKGIKLFWLDEAEPEYTIYDFDIYRYWKGSNLQIGNLYPLNYAQTFYEGMQQAGQENIVNLLRCAWAGSQKFGALVWSGDIASSWGVFRCQLVAGLNMGMAGIPWWTTDIGGFHGGDPNDEKFRELFVRWFQWGCFCPVMRLHGDREPKQPQHGTTGGATMLSGAPNEVWSYGEKVLGICTKYLHIREYLRPYTRELMQEAHKKGTPVMRPMFYEFPEDERAWRLEDQFFYGSKYLVAPILAPGALKRKVYLPKGKWIRFEGDKVGENAKEGDKVTGDVFDGGQDVEIECTLEDMPVFERQ